MPDPQPHHKLIKHFEVQRQARLLTFSCVQRRALLVCDEWCVLLAEGLERALAGHGFLLLAFVFMPEHVHLVVVPWEEDSRVSELLFAIKRPVSYRIKSALEERADPLLTELTIRERPGKMAFRFWQEGPGHDRNLRTEEALANAIAYVHRNPVERALCSRADEWKWSSARQYLNLDVPPGVPRVTRWPWPRTPEAGNGATGGLPPVG